MTTCREIVRQAMLEIKALASGEQPTADELSDAMICLQSIMDGLMGFGIGTSLTDVDISSATQLTADSRNIVTGSPTLTLPDEPKNGQRIQIIGTATVTGIGAVANATYIYSADSASWMVISPLSADATCPLGDDEFFRLELAKRLIPMFGGSLTQESGAALLRATNRLKARYRSQAVTPCDTAVTFLSRQSYNTGFLGQ